HVYEAARVALPGARTQELRPVRVGQRALTSASPSPRRWSRMPVAPGRHAASGLGSHTSPTITHGSDSGTVRAPTRSVSGTSPERGSGAIVLPASNASRSYAVHR